MSERALKNILDSDDEEVSEGEFNVDEILNESNDSDEEKTFKTNNVLNFMNPTSAHSDPKVNKEIRKKSSLNDLKQPHSETLPRSRSIIEKERNSNKEDIENLINEFNKSDNLVNDILNTIDDDLNLLSPASSQKIFQKKKSTMLDPLEIIDKEEREMSQAFSTKELEKMFIISNKSYELSKIQNISQEILNFITEKFFEQIKNNYVSEISLGLPKSIAVWKHSLIALGTSSAKIVLFSENPEKKDVNMSIFVGNRNNGAVTALDFTKNAEFIAAGHELGQIIIWEVAGVSVVKVISGIHNTPVLSIKFWIENKLSTISSDCQGNVYLLNVNKMFFSYTIDKQLLLQKTAGLIHSIKPMDRSYQPPDLSIVAMCSLEVALVIVLEPIVRILYKQEKPEYLKDNIMSSIAWGNIYLPKYNKNDLIPSLAIAWGNIIEIVPFENVSIKKTMEYTAIAHVQLDFEIIFIEFLSEKILACVDTRKNLHVLYTGFFKKGKFNIEKKKIFSAYAIVIVGSKALDSELTFQTYLKDKGNSLRPFYSNTISVCEKSQTIYFIGHKKIFNCKFLNWIDYIKQEINLKKDWNSIFSLCVELHKGTSFPLHGLSILQKTRHIEMQGFINHLAVRYLDTMLNAYCRPFANQDFQSKMETWRDYILIIIDFMTSVENNAFLFKEIKWILDRSRLGEVFLACMEPFIIKKRLKSLPSDSFRELVSFFEKKNKIKVLQQLIINIEPECVDPGFIISVCLEYNLHTALIFVCTQKELDFMTPLVKIYNAYALSEKNNKNLGYKLLWFIQLTLEGKLFPEGQIPEKNYQIVVRQLVVWLFVEEIIKKLLKIDELLVFKVFLILFKGKAAEILQQRNLDLFEYFQAKTNENSPFFVQSEILQILKTNTENPDSFMNFIANLEPLKEFGLDFELCAKSARFFLKKPEALKLVSGKIVKEEEEFLEEKGKMILNLLRPFENELKTSSYLQELIFDAEESEFLDVHVYLLFLKQEYIGCVELFLSAQVDNDKLRQFSSYLFSRLSEFVLISPTKTKEFLQIYRKNSEKEAIYFISNWPHIQLELLEQFIEDRNIGITVENELLILYINLLAKLDKDKLLTEIKQFPYPLEETLKICEENNIKEARAFLLLRKGAAQLALELYIELFQEQADRIARKIEKNKFFHKTLLKDYVKASLDICKDSQDNKVWFWLLDKVLDYKTQQLSKKKIDPKFKPIFDIFNEVVDEIFDGIVNHIPLQSLMNKIETGYGYITLGYLRSSFLVMFSNYNYVLNILFNSRMLIMSDITDNNIKIALESARGKLVIPTCGECEENFTEFSSAKIVCFFCSHGYHKKCLNFYKCDLCLLKEKNSWLRRINTIKKKKGEGEEVKIIEDKIVDGDESERIDINQIRMEIKEKNIRKLKYYDERIEEERKMWDVFKSKYENFW